MTRIESLDQLVEEKKRLSGEPCKDQVGTQSKHVAAEESRICLVQTVIERSRLVLWGTKCSTTPCLSFIVDGRWGHAWAARRDAEAMMSVLES